MLGVDAQVVVTRTFQGPTSLLASEKFLSILDDIISFPLEILKRELQSRT